MSFDERQALGQNIQKLSSKNKRGIIDIMGGKDKNDNKVIEFDLNTLGSEKCWQLQDYVNRCLIQ